VKRPPLGQHFLRRPSVLERIAAAAAPQVEPLIIEIGPGRGALTEHLSKRAGRLVAIELDAKLARELQGHFAAQHQVEVLHADVRNVNLAQWGPAVVAGNLPYYITSPVLDQVLEMGRNLVRAVLLVQKEVADRLTAEPGHREYGYLTVRTAFRAQARTLFHVPASAFSPPPKVESAVVELNPRAQGEDLPVEDGPGFLEFVGRCFRQKRKTIRNNLSGWYPRQSMEALPEASLRAEQLGLADFLALYRRLTP